MPNKGFHDHIQEAIVINKIRKIKYAKLSGGKTKGLSNALIFSEQLTLPIAKYYDKKGKIFNDKGVMVVKNDFVDMNISPLDREVKHRSAWTNKASISMKSFIQKFISTIPKKFESDESLKTVLDNGRNLYLSIEAFEKEEDIHTAMTKHLFESICFIIKNGLKFSEQSQGSTRPLTGALIKLHQLALKNCLWMDRWGNRFHQQNIGILVNDMPVIEVG